MAALRCGRSRGGFLATGSEPPSRFLAALTYQFLIRTYKKVGSSRSGIFRRKAFLKYLLSKGFSAWSMPNIFQRVLVAFSPNSLDTLWVSNDKERQRKRLGCSPREIRLDCLVGAQDKHCFEMNRTPAVLQRVLCRVFRWTSRSSCSAVLTLAFELLEALVGMASKPPTLVPRAEIVIPQPRRARFLIFCFGGVGRLVFDLHKSVRMCILD